MTPRFLKACQSMQPAEKACWDILLRESPDAEAIAPETLDQAMDRTLEQLWTLLQSKPEEARLKHATAATLPLPTDAECALTMHLPYFNAGERALELIADELMQTEQDLGATRHRRDRDELCSAYNVLVHCQLEAICRRCGHAGVCRHGDLRAVARLPSSRPPFEVSPAESMTPKRRRGPAPKTRRAESEGNS